jgi:hypothetical protein
VTWGAAGALAFSLIILAAMLSHFADSRSSGLRASSRRLVDRAANSIYLLALTVLLLKTLFSAAAYLHVI